jgi:transcription termination factor Rho
VNRSGTRREELLIKADILPKVWILRKLLFGMTSSSHRRFLPTVAGDEEQRPVL